MDRGTVLALLEKTADTVPEEHRNQLFESLLQIWRRAIERGPSWFAAHRWRRWQHVTACCSLKFCSQAYIFRLIRCRHCLAAPLRNGTRAQHAIESDGHFQQSPKGLRWRLSMVEQHVFSQAYATRHKWVTSTASACASSGGIGSALMACARRLE
jgi:hypothetical protein